MPTHLLQDKVVLITGSTSGIGAATARRCAALGARVMLHGRREEDGPEIRAELSDAGYVAADFEDRGAPQRVIEATIAKFGRLDALINNAALVTRSNLETTDLAIFDLLVAVNLRTPLFMIQAALPHFRSQGGGVVLNIGSINAFCGEPNLLVYSITKGGLMTMTRNLADAHAAEHIRFNQINVGWTLTENEDRVQRKHGQPEDWEDHIPREFAPSGRLLRPEEIAAHAAFWISDAAGPVSGAVFEVEQYPMIGRNADKE